MRDVVRCQVGEETPLVELPGPIDEVAIGEWFHVEQQTENGWWMRVGDALVAVTLSDGRVEVEIHRGEYASVDGGTWLQDKRIG